MGRNDGPNQCDRSKVIPNTKEEGDDDQEESEPGAKVKLGIRVQSLTPQQAKEFAMQPDEGVFVANVEAGGVADEAGLKPNDVILQVNKVPVHSPEELKNVSSETEARL
jgi:serine protease Do